MSKVITKGKRPKQNKNEGIQKQRNYYIDNLKVILIIFVVMGHFALKLQFVKEIKYILYFIYTFHMPCFIFTSGFLAKRMNVNGKLRVNKIMSIIWMYLLFKVGNVLLGYLFHKHVGLSLLVDSTAPWYLLALSIWYLSVPILERIKTGYLIVGSFLIGLVAGYINCLGLALSLSRVFVFFPFFIIGFCLSQDMLDKALSKKLKIPAVLFIVFVFTGFSLFWDKLKPFKSIVYGTASYAKSLGHLANYGLLIRGLWYLLAIALSVAIIFLVPRGKVIFSVLGERTLQIYITHIWIRNALVYAGFFVIIKAGPDYLVYIVLLASVALALLLANSWLKKAFDIIMPQKLFNKMIKNDN